MAQKPVNFPAESSWDSLAPGQDTRDLAAMVRRFFGDRFGPDVMRRALDEPAADSWQSLMGLGLPAIGLPESAGGDGTLLDCAVVLEEAGRAFVTEPLLASAMANLTQAAAGLHHPDWQSTAGALGVGRPRRAGSTSESMIVDVLDLRETSRLTLVLPSDSGARICVIEPGHLMADVTDTAGHIDPTRTATKLQIDPTSLADSSTTPDQTLPSLLAPARVAVAADLVGLAAAALDSAVAHVLQREQFGRQLGSFQAVKHALADAYVAVERARSLTWGAAVTISAGGPAEDIEDLPRLAKAAASDAANVLSKLHTQLLGALGMTFEADSHLFVRRAAQTTPFLGSASELYAAVARTRHRRSRHA